MKIGFVSDRDPYNDKKSWSGTVYKLRESIENAGHEIVWIKFDKELSDFSSKLRLKLLILYMKYTKKNVIGTCYLDFFCKYIPEMGTFANFFVPKCYEHMILVLQARYFSVTSTLF